ncbi:pepsin-like aspartic protease [Echinimonas agarilytica]|uniref:A1 family peptidase n=1 Tax=Echinimonas agarilytica TaxID=1215918 RepID=A0AA41W717_9GAMM|nr:pepsin-like aspartic protease [Echinimonas agarilytica]MCM2679846.1 A1 family peptidase [Echinimonas agarilytica]
MTQGLRIPINVAYAEAGYCATIQVGSHGRNARVILDTGSATLAIKDDICEPENDAHLTTTSLAQDIIYGIGAWAGPVVHTTVRVANGQRSVELNGAAMAIMESEISETFAHADGIWGLAYSDLNPAYNIQGYLDENTLKASYPWPFRLGASIDDYRQLRTMLKQYPKQYVTPFFTDMEQHGLVANKFALYTQRAFRFEPCELSQAQYADLDENKGFLILGGGEEQTDLYEGDFQTIEVVHDKHYNVHLKSLQIGDQPAIAANNVDPKFKHCVSNAVVDSGCTYIILEQMLFEQLRATLASLLPTQHRLIDEFYDIAAEQTNAHFDDLRGIAIDKLDLAVWPTLKFIFQGDIESNAKADSSIEVPPESYWQCHSPAPNEAFFAIIPQFDGWPNQTNFGLPMLNNYFAVFDRSADMNGELRLAKRRQWHAIDSAS